MPSRARSPRSRRISDRQIRKGVLESGEKDDALARIRTSTGLTPLDSIDLVVEAATENREVKFEIFAGLDEIARPGAILATNTSSISISEIAARTTRSERVIGMHFMNPAPVMQLLEVIRGLQTADQTYRTVTEVGRGLDKTVAVESDFPSFVSNRILMPMINEAVFRLMEGVADRESIDTGMKLGMNHPLGARSRRPDRTRYLPRHHGSASPGAG